MEGAWKKNIKGEVLAGFTTFFTMSYILVVNPVILSASGMPKEGVVFATAVASAIATFVMGTYAGLPFALAPGMGLNAYFAYTVCAKMGIPWQTALSAVFVEGVVFLTLALVGARRAILRAIPATLAYAISAGIGLFIALIGLKNAHIIVSNTNTLVALGDLKSFEAVVTIASLILTGILVAKKVAPALLLGIAFAEVVGVACGKVAFPEKLLGFPQPTAAFQLDFASILTASIVPVVLAFLIVDIFDTVGTLSGLCARLGVSLSDSKVEKALTADAVGTTVGSLLGTSTVTTYIESASGVATGGRTGVTAIAVALLFLLSTFLHPLISAVPDFATSAALIYVGGFMLLAVKRINWEEPLDMLPAFITLIGIPLTFSISDGMGLGFLTYTATRFFAGRWREINLPLVLITALFLFKFFLW